MELTWKTESYFKIVLSPSDYRKVAESKAYCSAKYRSQEECTFSAPAPPVTTEAPANSSQDLSNSSQTSNSTSSQQKTKIIQDVTQIHFVDTGLPSSTEKHSQVAWEVRAPEFLHMNTARWIYCGPIFGRYMFGESHDTSPSTAEYISSPFTKTYAYKFGDGSNCRGVLSNNLVQFIGLEYQKGEDLKNGKFVVKEIPIEYVNSSVEWYKYVRAENGRKLSFWHSPVTRYSPISNLYRQTKKGALASMTESLYEAGELTQEQVFALISMDTAPTPNEVDDEAAEDPVPDDQDLPLEKSKKKRKPKLDVPDKDAEIDDDALSGDEEEDEDEEEEGENFEAK